jgi:hypothetical protein
VFVLVDNGSSFSPKRQAIVTSADGKFLDQRMFLLWWFDLNYVNYIVVGINMNDERYVLVLFAPQRIWVVYLVVLVVLIVLDALTIVADCAGHALAAVGTLALRSLARLAALTGTLILGLRLQRQR